VEGLQEKKRERTAQGDGNQLYAAPGVPTGAASEQSAPDGEQLAGWLLPASRPAEHELCSARSLGGGQGALP